MKSIDDKRLERVLGTLEEATAALREANDRMERAYGIEPPQPRPALSLVKDQDDDS